MQIWNWLPYIPGKVLSSYGLFLFFLLLLLLLHELSFWVIVTIHSIWFIYFRDTRSLSLPKSLRQHHPHHRQVAVISPSLSVVVNHPYFIGEKWCCCRLLCCRQRSSCWGWLRSSDTLPLLQFDGNVRWWLGWELYLPPGPTTVVWLYCIGHHHSFWKNIFDPIFVSSCAFFL